MYSLKSYGLHGDIPNHLKNIPTKGIFIDALEPNNLLVLKKSCVIHAYYAEKQKIPWGWKLKSFLL